jgi:uncharacterized Zn-binding protein involved in type VI secretion
MPPAARIGDMHTRPMVSGVVPQVGGRIAMGLPTARIGCMPAARLGDLTVHGGVVTKGYPTVMIGG